MTTWSIREVPVSETVDGNWLLHGYTDAINDVIVSTWGNHDFERSAAEILGSMHDQQYDRKPRLVAVADDDADTPDPARVLGYSAMILPLQDNTHTAHVDLGVRPGHRRQGIGSSLYDTSLALVREAGRTQVTASTDHSVEPPDGPGTLAPSTGAGRVAADADGPRFALQRGFALEQVGRYSVLDLPYDAELIAKRADAEAQAGPDYRLVSWQSHAPQEWVDAYALLLTRMSTDAPLGGLDLEEDVWDAERIRRTEKQWQDRGLELLVLAAEHVPTHTLAAFTCFMEVPTTSVFVHQDDTLVLREHRGKRLGMLVKTANLQRLAVERPSIRRVGTWNAQENSYMLAINVALGFHPAGGAGEWQLKLG
ncbi:GNAT family N-acetyltransferase [Cellulomonas fengjieae]|uniref:GNAT family N-acetyltransferase n=1 Tax=Cellulomonas fengjieae TaxID=2819978 RepID=A0ABS3SKE4_9CELL|nr:GNAT family N-acetyltransferase [Cellulomonas fengjieae]MBO3086213.1 GNAT family N-acetyltransferase [Cellulomonas fengjieae]QVI65735.1 GNAT family N-acetyltransferase [Cellulomonas fengjieae]